MGRERHRLLSFDSNSIGCQYQYQTAEESDPVRCLTLSSVDVGSVEELTSTDVVLTVDTVSRIPNKIICGGLEPTSSNL